MPYGSIICEHWWVPVVLAAFVMAIGNGMGRESAFCSSKFLSESHLQPTGFCTFQGVVIHYASNALVMWFMVHTINLVKVQYSTWYCIGTINWLGYAGLEMATNTVANMTKMVRMATRSFQAVAKLVTSSKSTAKLKSDIERIRLQLWLVSW